jgi:hypothetical protein
MTKSKKRQKAKRTAEKKRKHEATAKTAAQKRG